MKLAANTLVFDNGAYEIKAGFSGDSSYKPVLNCISKARNERKRVFVGNQLKECKDMSSLFLILPFQKGFLLNLDTEHQIWDYAFGKDCLRVNFEETCLIFTEPHFNFKSIQEAVEEVLFEDYRFNSLLMTNPSTLSAYNYSLKKSSEQCQLIVDVGYSFTHVVPYCRGRKIYNATYRNSIGGKALTNHLKEIISYRQLHVMEETYVINQCKEDVGFVSSNFLSDLKTAKFKDDFTDYILPDFTTIHRGHVKQPHADKLKTKDQTQNGHDEQVIRLNHERFTIPEMLFHPSDVGFMEMGLSELIVHAINQCPEAVRPHMSKNIVLTGGSCLFHGLANRIRSDVRSLMPEDFEVDVFMPADPIGYAWQGGSYLAQAATSFPEMLVTREEYMENGPSVCSKKFDL